MKFTDYILTDAIVPELKATDKEGVIREMVLSLVDAGGIQQEDYEGVVKALIKRESLGSTGLGRGVATPYTRYPSVKCHVGAVAISTEGIVFDDFFDEKVQLFFLVISPTPDDTSGHVRIMGELTGRLGKDDTLRESLKQSKTKEDILALLEEDDSKEKR
jgi:PTS system fructose-specific IIA component/PTS system nitrogen regulatory IIA component